MPHPHRHCSLASSPQSDPNDELEAQTSKLRKADILLSSLPLGQEKQHSVVLEVKFSLALGGPCLPCDHPERSGAHAGQLPEHQGSKVGV